MAGTVQVYHRRVDVGLPIVDDSPEYQKEYAAGFKGYYGIDDDSSRIMFICLANQLLRAYVYKSMMKYDPDASFADIINQYWGIVIKNEPEFHDKYIRVREMFGYDRAPGWISREHADDIARFMHNDRNTVYSQTPKELLEQIEKAGA